MGTVVHDPTYDNTQYVIWYWVLEANEIARYITPSRLRCCSLSSSYLGHRGQHIEIPNTA